MRKMIPFAIIFLLGVAVSSWILRREIRRAPLEPAEPKTELGAVDTWQRSIRLATPTGYSSATDRERALLEKLQQEEERQRPQEGRN
jgi:hypothetical protein